VGLLAAKWSQLRGAARVVGIDNVPERISLAQNALQIETINFKEQDVQKMLHQKFPDGVDVAIECVGYESSTSWKHNVEMALMLETSPSDLFNEMFNCTRSFGNVSIIGVYNGYANHFPVGTMMQKGLTVRGSQCPVQKYWKMNLEKIRKGEFDPTFVVTTKGALSQAPELYQKFSKREEGIVKVFLRPDDDVVPSWK